MDTGTSKQDGVEAQGAEARPGRGGGAAAAGGSVQGGSMPSGELHTLLLQLNLINSDAPLIPTDQRCKEGP